MVRLQVCTDYLRAPCLYYTVNINPVKKWRCALFIGCIDWVKNYFGPYPSTHWFSTYIKKKNFHVLCLVFKSIGMVYCSRFVLYIGNNSNCLPPDALPYVYVSITFTIDLCPFPIIGHVNSYHFTFMFNHAPWPLCAL